MRCIRDLAWCPPVAAVVYFIERLKSEGFDGQGVGMLLDREVLLWTVQG